MIARFVLTLMIACSAIAAAGQCSQTPVAAAQAAVETKTPGGRDGFRATEAVVDLQTGRVWVRVIACGHPERPAALVPFGVPAVSLGAAATPQRATEAQPRVQTQIVVRPGDAVRVRFASSGAQVQLEGKAEEQGAVGQVITVRMQSLMGDAAQPARRVKAVITAAGEATIQS